jgi:putative transposase
MPRANRFLLPGHVWHITHRCHQREFLLKFGRDRQRWRYWLFEARKRFGLSVLNYVVTSNHIHLLVVDRGQGEIARSMQLIAGRTAQEYNKRKQRRGAYWEDRYHATAVDTDGYLARCMTYIDMNMVRAGAVSHPAEWDPCGYREIQQPPMRYCVIDLEALMNLLGIRDLNTLQRTHAASMDEALKAEPFRRDESWTKSLAVGSQAFVARFQSQSGIATHHREIVQGDDCYRLREPGARYNSHFDPEMVCLRADNAVFMDEFL